MENVVKVEVFEKEKKNIKLIEMNENVSLAAHLMIRCCLLLWIVCVVYMCERKDFWLIALTWLVPCECVGLTVASPGEFTGE